MKKLLIIVPLLALLIGCATTSLNINLYTNPNTYLCNFPIGISQTVIYQEVGPPDSRMNFEDKVIWTYQYGEYMGLRKFTFEFKDGKVIDVRYNSQISTLNNLSAVIVKKILNDRRNL